MQPKDDTGGHDDNGGKFEHITINHESKEGEFNSKVDYHKEQHIKDKKKEKGYNKEEHSKEDIF